MSIEVCALSRSLPSAAEVSIRSLDIKSPLHDSKYLYAISVSDNLDSMNSDRLTIARTYAASVGYRRK